MAIFFRELGQGTLPGIVVRFSHGPLDDWACVL